jgi:hypothetical protein
MTNERTMKTKHDLCKFCGSWVNLDDEGNTHRDGTVSHESCADSDTYQRENEQDLN